MLTMFRVTGFGGKRQHNTIVDVDSMLSLCRVQDLDRCSSVNHAFYVQGLESRSQQLCLSFLSMCRIQNVTQQ
jgi:hypothetical protein